jgi:hypothetical protein
MSKFLACFVCVGLAASLVGAPVIPGTIHVVQAKDGDQEIKAQPKDVVEVRISNPVLPKRVHDLDVDTGGDGIMAGVVNTRDPKLVGSDRISIFVGLKGSARSATVNYSYKDGGETEHKGKIIIQVIRKKDGK